MLVTNTRTDLNATNATTNPYALLTEKGREGVFVPQTYSSLSSADQTDVTNDTQQADYVLASPYVWVRKIGVPNSVQKYGMLPENTASANTTAFNAALAREPYLVIPAETNPYLLNSTIVSTREGQIIEGEGFNTVLKCSSTLNAPLIRLATNRKQQVRSLTIEGDEKAKYGIQLDYPKCDLVDAQVLHCTLAGVWMSHFTTSVSNGCYIDYNGIGIYASDGTGQINNLQIGGGRRGSISGNKLHGILVDTPGRDNINIENWNMENNCTNGNYAHVAFNSWASRIHISNMYHETDLDNAAHLFYRFTSSIEGVSMNNIKMGAGSPVTKPSYFIHICNSGGTIAEGYSLENIWAEGYTSHMINNGASAGGYNEILLKSIFLSSHTGMYNSANAIRYL